MPHNELSRREMLKTILSAGGGLGLALMLPDKWVKPAIKKADLPRHAQTSIPTPVLSELQVTGNVPVQAQSPKVNGGFPCIVSFHFDNAYNTGMSKIHGEFAWMSQPDTTPNSTCTIEKTVTPGGSTFGDYKDNWDICDQDGCYCDATIYFLDELGRQSNTMKVSLPSDSIPC